MLKDEPAEQCLPVPGNGVHPVDGHAGADGGKGVPGKIKVGHGVYGKGIVLVHGGEMVAEPAALFPQVAAADASHHGRHHFPVVHAGEILLHGVPRSFIRQARLVQKLRQEFLPHLRGGQGIHHQIHEVHHLHPCVPQALGEGVMLRLRFLQVGDIVKQQPFQIFRHKVFQLLTGPVQHDFPQPPDLRGVMDACFHTITPFPVTSLGFQIFALLSAKRLQRCKKRGMIAGKGCDTHETLRDHRRRGDPDL